MKYFICNCINHRLREVNHPRETYDCAVDAAKGSVSKDISGNVSERPCISLFGNFSSGNAQH